jgi:hypothetical protein
MSDLWILPLLLLSSGHLSSSAGVDQVRIDRSADQLLLFRGTHSLPLRASDPEVFIGSSSSSHAVPVSDESVLLSIPGSSAKESYELSNEFQLIRPDRIVDLRTIGVAGDSIDRRLWTDSSIAHEGRAGDVTVEATASVYNITDITPVVIDNNDVVTVYFESSNPQSNDWIGR